MAVQDARFRPRRSPYRHYDSHSCPHVRQLVGLGVPHVQKYMVVELVHPEKHEASSIAAGVDDGGVERATYSGIGELPVGVVVRRWQHLRRRTTHQHRGRMNEGERVARKNRFFLYKDNLPNQNKTHHQGCACGSFACYLQSGSPHLRLQSLL